MDQLERQKRIVEYLRIKPINHGQIHISQIVVPEHQIGEISQERREKLKQSLIEQGSNLIPLIVRRLEVDDDLQNYEVVYGADWCLVSQELNIERLWVWVFDLTDQQAAAAKAQMEDLATASNFISELPSSSEKPQELQRLLQQFENSFQEVESISNTLKEMAESVKNIKENISTQIDVLRRVLTPELPKPPKLNLRLVTEKEIKEALSKVKATSTQINAAWKAIQHWKKPGKDLTWENLEKSTKTGKDKVPSFTKTVYDKLKEIADIYDENVT